MICSACNADNAAEANLCANCGAALTGCCPSCATEFRPGARFCSHCGHPLIVQGGATAAPTTIAKPEHPSSVAGERRQVSILFADFAGFTSFSERLDPEDLRDTMNSLWANLDAIITNHGGTPEKHSGDAIMAVFGGWRSREEDPVEAVRAALAMQAWLNARESGPALRLRIGIHTGVVVVGPADHSGEFLATGDAVNLASRLEQSAPEGGVLVSRETYSQIYGLFDAQARPPLLVKGKSEPIETYLILRAKPRGLAMQLRGIEGLETELIGRQQELQRLQGIFEQVMHQPDTRVVMVVGEGGIGKSRLLREFQKWTDLLPEYFRLFCGRATPETVSLPFSLIADLFTSRFEIQESDPAPAARDKFERGLAGLLGGENSQALSRATTADIHFLGQLLGLDFSASPHLRDLLGDSEQIRQRAFHSLIRLFVAIANCPATDQFPAISAIRLVLEDLHWADEGSLDLVEHLARNCRGVPLMILCSARPAFFDRRPNWCAGLPNVTRINLEPLSPTESDTMVKAILSKAPEIPPALTELVTEGAEGNPFFIEEMIKMLMDQQVIIAQPEAWRIELDRLVVARVPSTLTGVLQARLDGLSLAERSVVQRASVVGKVFWDTAVAHMSGPPAPGRFPDSGLGKPDVKLALESLRRKGLVFRREASAFAGSVEYAFRHELFRNVAYESLLKKTRRQHHARIAEWIKDHGGGHTHEFAGLVAAHFEQAAQLAEAAEWHGRAGHQARLGYAPAIASRHFQKALEFLPPDLARESAQQKQQLDWHEGLAETLAAQARFADGLESASRMLALAQRLSDSAAEARAWNNLAFLHERLGDNRSSIQCAERAEALASSSDAGRAEKVRALQLKAWAFYRLGEAQSVLTLADQSLALSTDNRRGIATSLKLLGVAHLQLGHYDQADSYFEQGRPLFHELGDLRNTAAMLSNRGETARARGDFPAAADFYTQALTIVRQIGARESELIYQCNLCAARLGLEQFSEAEADLRQVIAHTLAHNSCSLAEAYGFLGEACLGQGKLAEAIAAAQKAIALARESESALYLGGAWRTLGRIAARGLNPHGQPCADLQNPSTSVPAPADCFAESLRVLRSIHAPGEQALTLREWGAFDLTQHQAGQGLARLHEARSIFQRLGASAEVALTEKLITHAQPSA